MRSLPIWRSLFALTLGCAVGLGGLSFLGCGKSEPVQAVNFHEGRLSMGIAPAWVLQRDSGAKAFYRFGDANGVRLSFEDQTRDWGTPMTVASVRSAIGSELNLAYGGVNARLSYSGNAILSYARKAKEGRKQVLTHNWVVARPVGYGAIARVAITLKVPAEQEHSPEILALVESLDKQVGDAVMPEV